MNRFKIYVLKHKIASFIVLVIILICGYFTYKKIAAGSVAPQYILASAHRGSIIETVTGSGQVSSENQIDVASDVSGKVLSINAKVGQTVRAGDLIATLDSHDALVDLQNSQIAYDKLVEPAKEGDVTNAQNNLNKSYSDGLGAISTAFLHIPNVLSGLKDLFYSREGYLSDSQSTNLTMTGKGYRSTASQSYDTVNGEYDKILNDYRSLTKTSATSSIEVVISEAYDFMKEVAETLKNSQAAITFISVSQPDYNTGGKTIAANNVIAWSGQVTSDLSNLLSAKNSIASSRETLRKLAEGADKLDIQSQKLALDQKARVYQKYFIRAPFEGVVGRIPVNVYDQANSGTVIATISSNQKITNIPLNEVDAVKVAVGQKASLTFDAILGLKIEGTVSQVDLVGTASQGVVTYNIKISFDAADTRIRPGMSVDSTIITREKTDVLVVPSSAVKSQGTGAMQKNYVETFVSTSTAKSKTLPIRKNVTVGESDDANTEITEGLNDGEKVVVRTVASGTASGATPSLFSGLGGGTQRNVIRNTSR